MFEKRVFLQRTRRVERVVLMSKVVRPKIKKSVENKSLFIGYR